MWLESEYILNVEPAEFPDRLHIGCEKKTGVRMTLFFSAWALGGVEVSFPETRKSSGAHVWDEWVTRGSAWGTVSLAVYQISTCTCLIGLWACDLQTPGSSWERSKIDVYIWSHQLLVVFTVMKLGDIIMGMSIVIERKVPKLSPGVLPMCEEFRKMRRNQKGRWGWRKLPSPFLSWVNHILLFYTSSSLQSPSSQNIYMVNNPMRV